MKISYNVEIPRSESEDINELYKFIEGSAGNMKIAYEDKHKAIARYSVLKRKIENDGMPVTISRIDADVYVQRVEVNADEV